MGFYMHVVGFKVQHKKLFLVVLWLFYMHVVGFKDQMHFIHVVRELDVLYARSGF